MAAAPLPGPPKSIEVEGRSVQDAIRAALKELGLTLEQVDIEVLSEPTTPGQPFKIRATPIPPEAEESAEEKVEDGGFQPIEVEGRSLREATEKGLKQLGVERSEVQIEVLHEPLAAGELYKLRMRPKPKEEVAKAAPAGPKVEPIQIVVAEDEMEAYLNLRWPPGVPRPVPKVEAGDSTVPAPGAEAGPGKDAIGEAPPPEPAEPIVPPVKMEDIEKALADAKVTVGIDRDVIMTLFAEYAQGREVVNQVVARGRPAVPGVEPQLKIHVSQEGRPPEGAGNGDGGAQLDFREWSFTSAVAADAVVATRIPGKPPEPGVTVKGRTVKGPPWRDQRVLPGKNVRAEQKPEGSIDFIAARGGVLRPSRDKVEIVPLLSIDGDVDFSVGHVKFDGAVRIRGRVLGGFRVHAEEDIFVGGEVEGAVLRAKGSIMLSTGVMGQDRAELWAGVEVRARYAERASIFAVKGVQVGESVVSCTVISGGSITVLAGKGKILGGVIVAGELIEARQVGSPSVRVNVLRAGRDPKLETEAWVVRGELDAADRKLAAIKEQWALSRGVRQTVIGNLSELEATVRRLEREKRELGERLDRLTAAAANGVHPGLIRIQGEVFPAVDVSLGRLRRVIHDKTQVVVFYPDSKGRTIEVAEGGTRPKKDSGPATVPKHAAPA